VSYFAWFGPGQTQHWTQHWKRRHFPTKKQLYEEEEEKANKTKGEKN